jgi:hypothetical protein
MLLFRIRSKRVIRGVLGRFAPFLRLGIVGSLLSFSEAKKLLEGSRIWSFEDMYSFWFPHSLIDEGEE